MIESDPNFSTEQRRLCANDYELSLCDGCGWAKPCDDDGICDDCREENEE